MQTEINKTEDFLDCWQEKIEKGICLARQGKTDEVEVLCIELDSMLRGVCLKEELSEEFAGRAEKLKSLYNELCLILRTEMMHTAEALKHTKKGRLAARTYRSNV
jgi:hypothetical protein